MLYESEFATPRKHPKSYDNVKAYECGQARIVFLEGDNAYFYILILLIVKVFENKYDRQIPHLVPTKAVYS